MARGPWGLVLVEMLLRFAVTTAMLYFTLQAREESPGLSGVVVGLIAGYWLPAPRLAARTSDVRKVNGHG